MKTLLLALAGGVVSFLAFPPFGPGWLIVAGLALFLWSLRTAATRRQGFWVGFAYGLVFFGGFMWWLSQLELIALILIPVQALFPAVFGWWLSARVLKRTVLPKDQLAVFRLMMPLLKLEERRPPSFGLSLLALARRM